MAQYKNSFYNEKDQNSKKYFETSEIPIEHKGYFIYHRIKSTIKDLNVFDVVKDGICIGMYAGINGAKKFIDNL